MTSLRYHDGQAHVLVSHEDPLPVSPVVNPAQTFFAKKLPLQGDWSLPLIFGGYAYLAGDADQNDTVTGQTSFDNTTPTLMVRNPSTSDTLIYVPYYNLVQAGTVAGAFITVLNEVDNDVYASGGTSERVKNQRYGIPGPTANGLVYTGATATASYGISTATPAVLAADVEPAEGVINVYEWQNPGGVLLDPNTCMKSFTYAGMTGPTWLWGIPWFEFPLDIF